MNENDLGPDSTIKEIFKTITPDDGMRVVPTQVPAEEGKAHLAILITGNKDEAQLVLANLMMFVQDMHDTVLQQEQEDGPTILDAGGEPINDEPTIIVP